MIEEDSTILEDVVNLTTLIKDALETEPLESMIGLYDYYRMLDKVLRSFHCFINGHFSMDINEEIFQDTESFVSPESKWLYFTQRELKIFNDNILKFMRHSLYIGFSYESNIKKLLSSNLDSLHPKFIVKQYDNKFYFSNTWKEIVYEYLVINNDLDFEIQHCHSKEVSTILKTYSIETLEERENFIDNLKINIQKLEEFKLYLESYFLKHKIPKSLFIESKYNNWEC